MVRLTLEQGHSLATMAVVAAIAVALAVAFYALVFGQVRPYQWYVLLSLRVASIAVVVLLLFRPVFSYEKEIGERKAVVVLLDRSGSMSIADDASGQTRFAQARRQIEFWSQQLAGDFDLYTLAFADTVAPVDDGNALAALKADGAATSLSAALAAAPMAGGEKRLSPGRIEAVLLVSDGLHNTARRPEDDAARLGLVVHTVGVGASLQSDPDYRDIDVTGLVVGETLMLNNKARITAPVEGIGLPGRLVTATLEEDGKAIATQELTLDDTEGGQEVNFEFRPTVKGRHQYTVRLPAADGERIVQNNARSAVALVVEPGIRVLYIEGTLRQEYGAITERFLSRDPDLQFAALVQTQPNVFLRRSNIDDLKLEAMPENEQDFSQFDVFILGDLDSSYLKTPQQELLVDRLKMGAGLVMLGGYHSLGPGGYGGTPLGEALPVALGGRETGQLTEPLLPVLTPEGSRHAIFANIAEFFPSGESPPKRSGLPALDGCTRVGPARPGASVLAEHPVEKVAGKAMPVLAVQPVGKGWSAVFSGDTTRRWQQGPQALDEKSPFLQFWGQMVRFLAGRAEPVRTEARITASTDKAYYRPEENVALSAVVRNDRGEGALDARVVATVVGPGGATESLDLAAVLGSAGTYQSSFRPAMAGSYQVRLEARLGEARLEAEPLAVEVGRADLEFERIDLDEKRLAAIAAAAGGRYVHLSAAEHLVEGLNRAQRRQRLAVERPLAPPLPLWGLFVALVSTEWILRRRLRLR